MNNWLQFILDFLKRGKLTFAAFKSFIVEIAKKKLFKLALAKIAKGFFKTAIGGWVLNFAMEYLWDEVVEPILKMGLNLLGYVYNKTEGKIEVKKMQKAKQDGDQDAYDEAIDDIIS